MNSTLQITHLGEQLLKDARVSRLFHTLHDRMYDEFVKGVWENRDGNWMDIISYPPPAYTPTVAFVTDTGLKVLILHVNSDTIVLYEEEDALSIQYTAKINGNIEYGILDGNEEIAMILQRKVLFC